MAKTKAAKALCKKRRPKAKAKAGAADAEALPVEGSAGSQEPAPWAAFLKHFIPHAKRRSLDFRGFLDFMRSACSSSFRFLHFCDLANFLELTGPEHYIAISKALWG
jgi:hypothetical protein